MQTVTLFGVTVTVGVGLTVIVTCAVAVQPFAPVPVTVYVVVEAGVTETDEPEIFPGFHTYDVAPEEFNVVEAPAQIVVLVAVAVTVGEGLTVIVTCAVPVQPAVVPVTVYVVVAAGETVIGEPLIFPGFQVYDVAPEPVSVVELPAQIVELDAVAVTVGVGVTVTVIVAVFVHPALNVPVTVYVVVAAGETTTDVPLRFPGCQVYVVAPAPVSVVDPPEQIELLVALTVTFGAAATVTVTGTRQKPGQVPTQ